MAALALTASLVAFHLVELSVAPRYDFQLPLDRAIPFLPWTIFVYQSFVFYVIVAAALLEPADLRRAVRQAAVAIGVGLVCFALLPAAVSRPAASQISSPFLRQRFERLWWLDRPHNSFPSLHVAITWIATGALRERFARQEKRLLAGLAVGMGIAISLSTLTVKQHAVVDVAGGVALAALAMAWVSPRSSSEPAGLEPLAEIEPWRAVAALAADWGMIVACFAAAIRFPRPMVYAVAALLVARTQLALAVLMHESAHRLLFRSRLGNQVVGQFLAAGPLLVSLPAYRYGHLRHHRAPMAHDDPVAIVFEVADYPIPRSRLALRLLRDLTGLSNLVNLRRLLRGDYRQLLSGGGESRSGPLVPISILATHGSMLAFLALFGRPDLFVWLWLVPLLTLFQVMGRIRAIMEHAGYPALEDQTRSARTIVRPSWQTFFFGPHGVHFHIEHHRHVGVPFYRLERLHERMAAQGLLPAENLHRGYGTVLRDVTQAR